MLNNVNSTDDILTPLYIEKVAALACGVAAHAASRSISARASPRRCRWAGLKTADPGDPAVIAWWKGEIDMIYRAIPDFGGFLVKAASSRISPARRNMARPMRTAPTCSPICSRPMAAWVMYRAFVYADPRETPKKERAVQAYREFQRFDGQFRDNVIIQVKDGPFDFQPREPVPSAVRGDAEDGADAGIPDHQGISRPGVRTVLHRACATRRSCRRTPMRQGMGSTVAKVIDGTLDPHQLTGVAGVANTGSDRDWSRIDLQPGATGTVSGAWPGILI